MTFRPDSMNTRCRPSAWSRFDGARRGVCQVTESVSCFSDLTLFREVQEELRLYLFTVLSDWRESSQLNIKSKDATPFRSRGITGHSTVLICFIIRVNPLETSGRHLTSLVELLAFKEYYLTIFVDLLFGISFELVSKRLSL